VSPRLGWFSTLQSAAENAASSGGCAVRVVRTALDPARPPIRADLENRGRLIDPYDLMIAAHTQPVDAVLITDNTKQFDRVAAVRTDNWLATR